MTLSERTRAIALSAELPTPPSRAGNRPSTSAALLGGVALAVVGAVAARQLLAAPPGGSALLGFVALLVCCTVVERFTTVQAVGVTGKSGGNSLGIVFCASAVILLGPLGLLFAPIPRFGADLIVRKHWASLIVNAAGYATSGLAAYLVSIVIPHTDVLMLVPIAFACMASFFVTNMAWVSFCMKISAGPSFRRVFVDMSASAVVANALMVPTCVMLIVLWQRWPPLTIMLAGPLLSTFLYQKSIRNATLSLSAALTDTLTQLGNARAFEEFCKREIARSDRKNAPLALCMVDLDGFKQVNDTYGHPAGDQVLRAVAAELRAGGESFRLGGDEFALLLPGDDAEHAAVVAGAVLARIGALSFDFDASVGASAGIAVYPVDAPDAEELVAAADRALYQAKAAGKNRLRVAAVRPLGGPGNGDPRDEPAVSEAPE